MALVRPRGRGSGRGIRRLRRSQLASAAFYREHDILLTPTLATETPRIGHLDPTQEYDTIMGRLLEWVAFTPLQNVTGDPAISLPLATTAAGLPQGMMLAAGFGREATLDRATVGVLREFLALQWHVLAHR